MPSQFEGQVIYGIQCSKCRKKSERRTNFFEMEVNLVVRLQYLLESLCADGSTSIERLQAGGSDSRKSTGGEDDRRQSVSSLHHHRIVAILKCSAHRYHCEACDIKVDATRYTILDSLPPVRYSPRTRFRILISVSTGTPLLSPPIRLLRRRLRTQ